MGIRLPRARKDRSDLSPRKGWHYAWVIVLVSGIASSVGVEPMQLFGVFLSPVAEGLGVTRGQASLAYTIMFVTGAISSPVGGWACDRFGTRLVLLVSSVVTVLSLVLLGFASSLWQFYVFYGLIYGASRSGFHAPIFTTLTLWFKKRQGLAVGLVAAGLGIGPLGLAPLLRYAIDVTGWNNTFLLMAAGSAVILAPCCWFMRNKPSDLGLSAYGEDLPVSPLMRGTNGPESPLLRGKKGDRTQPAAIPAAAPPEAPFYRPGKADFIRYAVTTQPFFLLPLIHFLGCASHSIPLVHVVAMAMDAGIKAVPAATVLGVASGLSIAGRMGAPMIAERFGGHRALTWFILIQALGIMVLLVAQDLWVFYAFAMVFGIGLGGEMTPYPVLNRQYYGAAPVGMIYGFQMMAAGIGMGLGGYAGGLIYDLAGNYTYAIVLSAFLGFAGVGVSLLLVSPFRKKVSA